MPSTSPPQAVVRHINRNHVTIAPAHGYSVTVFNLAEGTVEAIICADDGTETIRLLVAGPGPRQTMAITTDQLGTGVVDIKYADTPDAS